MNVKKSVAHAVTSSGLADVLERVLDKGMVITGDIKIKLVDIELLTIQIRLLIASVEKASEMGIDWWRLNPEFSSQRAEAQPGGEVAELRERVRQLETRLAGQVTAAC